MMPLIVALLAAIAMGALGYALLGKKIEAEDNRAKRLKAIVGDSKATGRAGAKEGEGARERRKALQEALKQLETSEKQKQKERVTLKVKLMQAGLVMEPRSFILMSIAFGAGSAVVAFLSGQQPGLAAMIGFASGFGLPRWFLGFLKNRRERAFAEEFANALEIIVRGVKAGLPLNECLKVIARESPDPVGKEFREMIDGIAMGVTLEEALDKMAERMPIAEVNFFAIVLSIQAKSGGNLSEALGNLAAVLRDRKMMRAKIQAMSSEAKASAMIIGSLPFCVCALVYLTSPDYIMLLFKEQMGNVMVLGGLTWMTIGILVMKKMINFKF